MRALCWNGDSLKLERSHPDPQADGETALVRVSLAGICSTDLQILDGYLGFRGVPGHEFVGRVIDGPPSWKGRRVVGEINFACGRCEYCARDLGRHCPDRKVMGIVGADGAFAESVAVPAANLHPVPDALADEEAVFTEPLAAAFEILEQVPVEAGMEALVLGDGRLGLLCAQVLKLATPRVTLVGKHPRKLAVVQKSGIRTLLLQDWRAAKVDLAVEATGSVSGLQMACAAVRPRGTLVLKSTLAKEHRLSLAPLVIEEITVVGSRCGLFPPALEALELGSVHVAPLVDKIYPLEDAPEAIAHTRRPGALKILLRP
jgi:threonine dehydrogenase-like Zn-dependent dehydrogenase